jgi:hypothetical protein
LPVGRKQRFVREGVLKLFGPTLLAGRKRMHATRASIACPALLSVLLPMELSWLTIT